MLWICTNWKVDWVAISAIATAIGSLVAAFGAIVAAFAARYALRAAKASERAVDAAVKQADDQARREEERRRRITVAFARSIVNEAEIIVNKYGRTVTGLSDNDISVVNAVYQMFLRDTDQRSILDACVANLGEFEASEAETILSMIRIFDFMQALRDGYLRGNVAFDESLVATIRSHTDTCVAVFERLRRRLQRYIPDADMASDER